VCCRVPHVFPTCNLVIFSGILRLIIVHDLHFSLRWNVLISVTLLIRVLILLITQTVSRLTGSPHSGFLNLYLSLLDIDSVTRKIIAHPNKNFTYASVFKNSDYISHVSSLKWLKNTSTLYFMGRWWIYNHYSNLIRRVDQRQGIIWSNSKHRVSSTFIKSLSEHLDQITAVIIIVY
jgi:hypothetical protein